MGDGATGTVVRDGAVVVAFGALEALTGAEVDPSALVQCHAGGDWDELSAADRRENLLGVIYELRVSSVYTLPTGKRIRVVTEADRGVTIVLLSAEHRTEE